MQFLTALNKVLTKFKS